MDVGEFVILWTARLMVVGYLARLFHDLRLWPWSRSPSEKECRLVRNLWTATVIIYGFHVVAAFQFEHDWSHAAAYTHTAEQTARLTGWHWGGGIWINYLITLAWPLDVLATWRIGIDQLPRWYVIGLHTFLGFIIFQATVVFGSPVWIGIAVVLLGGIVLGKWKTRSSSG